MRRALYLTLIVLAAVSLANCMGRKEAPERHAASAADSLQVQQGITGKVEIWEGNFMPPVDPKNPRGKVTPAVKRRVRVHEPVRMEGGLASARRDSIPTPLVAETVTDSDGRFFVPVAPGTYSIFVEEEGGWYFNGWSGNGVQGEVTVPPDSSGNILIKITTKATY